MRGSCMENQSSMYALLPHRTMAPREDVRRSLVGLPRRVFPDILGRMDSSVGTSKSSFRSASQELRSALDVITQASVFVMQQTYAELVRYKCGGWIQDTPQLQSCTETLFLYTRLHISLYLLYRASWVLGLAWLLLQEPIPVQLALSVECPCSTWLFISSLCSHLILSIVTLFFINGSLGVPPLIWASSEIDS